MPNTSILQTFIEQKIKLNLQWVEVRESDKYTIVISNFALVFSNLQKSSRIDTSSVFFKCFNATFMELDFVDFMSHHK